MTTSSSFPNWVTLSCPPDQHSTFYMWSRGGNCPRKHGSNYTWLSIWLDHWNHGQSLHCLFCPTSILQMTGLACWDRLICHTTSLIWNKSPKGCSNNFLKFQKTGSKSEFHWTVPRRSGDGILKSHLHQLCIYLYHWSILVCRSNGLMGFGVRQIWD